MSKPLVVAITGASGVVYGQRLVEVLLQLGISFHLTISESGRQVLKHERHLAIDLHDFSLDQLLPDSAGWPEGASRLVWFHHPMDFMSRIASGSYQTAGMIVCPCSGSTLSGIASGSSSNLIQRAAEVQLKERRPLILVTRETPLSLIQIENMRTVTLAGATILPASPGFYHRTVEVQQLVDFVVARVLDQLQIEHQLIPRWGDE